MTLLAREYVRGTLHACRTRNTFGSIHPTLLSWKRLVSRELDYQWDGGQKTSVDLLLNNVSVAWFDFHQRARFDVSKHFRTIQTQLGPHLVWWYQEPNDPLRVCGDESVLMRSTTYAIGHHDVRIITYVAWPLVSPFMSLKVVLTYEHYPSDIDHKASDH